MKTAHSAQHGHRLHHPCPSGSPEIGLGKRKWVVLAPSLGQIPSKCVFLCLCILSPPTTTSSRGRGVGWVLCHIKGKQGVEVSDYMTLHPLHEWGN